MLEFDDVRVVYPGATAPALDGVSLTIAPGERVGLVGPSGAGKSTVIGLANGLVTATSGAVRVHGVDGAELGRRRHRAARSRTATVHQAFALVPVLTVAHNVAAGRLGSMGPARAVRTLVRPGDVDGIAAVLARVGIAERVWDRVERLSGGQRQRVAIARALYQDAPLVLADEPVSSLDPAWSGAALAALVQPVHDDPARCVVASLHDADLAVQSMSRIVGLRAGRVEFDLPADEVDADRLAALYELGAPEP